MPGRRGKWAQRAAVFRWSRAAGPLFALMALNLVDALFSAVFLAEGLMTEANPLMRVAWESSPGAFVAAKIALVGLGAWALWRSGRRGVPATALLVCLAAYAAVIGYHLLLMGNMVLTRS